jgi:hypothetical protein
MIIELNDQEATVLRQLLNLAVKAGGLEVAEAAVVIDKKIVEAARAAAQPRNADA